MKSISAAALAGVALVSLSSGALAEEHGQHQEHGQHHPQAEPPAQEPAAPERAKHRRQARPAA